MGGFTKRSRGSILIMALVLFSILLILALTFVGQEIISKEAAVRSQMAATQDSSIVNTVQRFADNFSAKPVGTVKLTFPKNPTTPSKPRYDLTFKSTYQRDKNFFVQGTWKAGNSIYYPPQEFPGKDFTDITQCGYYKDIAAQGCDGIPVSPWHNFIALNSSMKAKFFTVFTYSFPYGAFAPAGKIKLYDAYGCSNDIDDKDVNGDYFSSVPVDTYSKGDLEISEYVYGKALTATGKVAISSKKGAMAYPGISKNRQKEITGYGDILQNQLTNAFNSIKAATFNRDSDIFGTPITDIESLIDVGYNTVTLEQSASVPFGCMISFDNHPKEREMGCYYPFRIHAPFPADKVEHIGADLKAAMAESQAMYNNCNGAEWGFNYFDQDNWKNTDTDYMITNSLAKASEEIMGTSKHLGVEIASAAEELAESIIEKEDPEISAITCAELLIEAVGETEDIIAVIYILKYSKAYFKLKHFQYIIDMNYYLNNVKSIPTNRKQDDGYSNEGPLVISAYYAFKDAIRNKILGDLETSPATRFQDLGKFLMDHYSTKCRVVHFGWDDFNTNFQKIAEDGLTFQGTITIPRGRTLRMSRDLTITGDLWIQDGASLYVGGNLTLKASQSKYFSQDHIMCRPSGRLFLGQGSTLLVEKDFNCQGSENFGSVMVTSPADEINTISSGILCNGNINIPYGIMPGIRIDKLAEAGSGLTDDEINKLKTYIEYAPDIARVSGAFHRRADYFASKCAYFIAERIKDLDNNTPNLEKMFLVPVNWDGQNVISMELQLFTQVFATTLNANLGYYFLTRTDWWIFGDGSVPIVPKMNVEAIAPRLTACRSILIRTAGFVDEYYVQVKSAIESLPTAMEVLRENITLNGNVYLSFLNNKFGPGSDSGAIAYADKAVQGLNKFCQPLNDLDANIGKLGGPAMDSWMQYNTFCEAAYSQISDHLPGGKSRQSFQGAPGILVYAGKKLTLGQEDQQKKNITFPASGLLISNQDLQIYGSFRIVGCIVSLHGDIEAEKTRLRFYPYFTKASLYLPKNFKGDRKAEMTAIDDNSLKSGMNSLNIGITMPRFQSGGWEFYTEDYYGKD